jgi:ethanolamine ammonia-lyase small subunit
MTSLAEGAEEPTDPWTVLRRRTPARIGLGRAGDGLPVDRLLEFEVAHAQARDAVHQAVDFAAIETALDDVSTVTVRSAAPDRATYLQRPDLGRRLDPACVGLLSPGAYDAAFVIADGLSARAVQDHAAATLRETVSRLTNWRIAPVVLASQARVALGDEIGQLLGADMVVALIGERPGLSAADSLGIYLTYNPRVGRRDSERNCISNIHPPDGLGYRGAAHKLVYLMTQARRLGLSGIGLKDDVPALSAE